RSRAGAIRSLVGRTRRHRRRSRRIRPLLDLRGTRRHELLLRAVPIAALLAVHHRELRAPDAPDRRLVLEPLARDPHRRVPARLPRHLLLLPPLLLPRVLLVAAGLRGP